jgi:hypothetical protein
LCRRGAELAIVQTGEFQPHGIDPLDTGSIAIERRKHRS